ncbi:G-protein coupled receptor moody [Chionoecetes opilio]|uniref:G-protein coupled receptor moody n=1 Tax=Chionoecetes opilio TaxID=41210 RepID=A0A8J4YF75_CHIOP|nr:G-protein coupled receptor moody [Chionoecetes opilio]
MLSGASGASTPSLDVLTEASLTSSPYVNLSLAGIGEEVEMGDNGNHHYPADMLGFHRRLFLHHRHHGHICSYFTNHSKPLPSPPSGNLLTIIALPMTKTLRTTATAFVVNLAVVELLFCLFILPMSGAQYLYLQRHLQGSLLTDTHCIFFVHPPLHPHTGGAADHPGYRSHQVKLSSARVARSSTRSQAKVPPPTSSTTSTSSGTGTQRKGSTSSFKSLKKMVSETNLRARLAHN